MFYKVLFVDHMFSFHCNDVFYEGQMMRTTIFFILDIVASVE